MSMMRRTNAALQNAAHYTLTKVIRRGDEHYGFAVSDEGEDAFVPTNVCKRHNLTDADVGAGFKAMSRMSLDNANSGQKATRSLLVPLLFDDTAPVLVPGSAADLHNAVRQMIQNPPPVVPDVDVDALQSDLVALQADVDVVLDAVDQTLAAFAEFTALLESKHFNDFKAKLENLRTVVDARFPEEGKDQ
jgi:tRNA splicing ligase